MMELTEDFIKALQLALFVIGVLGIFFVFISYNITVEATNAEKEAFVLGDVLLSSQCLTVSNTKSLFSESKLEDMQIDSSCIKYTYSKVNVTLLDGSKIWSFRLGSSTSSVGIDARFIVLVQLKDPPYEIKPASMVVTV